MNEQAGIASHSPLIMADYASAPVRASEPMPRIWERSPRRLSAKDTFTSSAFLIFYTAAYLAAGYVGVTFMEWAWMRVFG
jgi:hypothetical protein